MQSEWLTIAEAAKICQQDHEDFLDILQGRQVFLSVRPANGLDPVPLDVRLIADISEFCTEYDSVLVIDREELEQFAVDMDKMFEEAELFERGVPPEENARRHAIKLKIRELNRKG